MSTLGVYVAKFFPRICTAIVDANLPRIRSVASTTYHGLSVLTWSAALGYHVLFQISYKQGKIKPSTKHFDSQIWTYQKKYKLLGIYKFAWYKGQCISTHFSKLNYWKKISNVFIFQDIWLFNPKNSSNYILLETNARFKYMFSPSLLSSQDIQLKRLMKPPNVAP